MSSHVYFRVFAWLLAGALPLCAATLTVTNTDDSGPGSLRQAIADAQAGDTIQFSVTGIITLTGGELLITKNLTVNGPSAGQLAISGNNNSRVFEIGSGATVVISGLTVENGVVPIYDGGGIANGGTLTILNSTVSGNSANATGGGIYNSGTLTITNSTVAGNSATGGGGGISNVFGAVTITSSTVAGNAAGDLGGGIFNLFGPAKLKNTLLANNGNGGNCRIASLTDLTSQGYNLSDDNTCASAFTQAGDANNVVKGAGLDPNGLQNNGGPTPTVALLPGSPAVNAIPVASCTDAGGNPLTADQRGFGRPQGSGCDVGAFELTQAGPVVTVDGAFQVGYASNFNLADDVVNITNTGASATTTPLVGNNSYGDICVNVYAYAPDGEFANCCTCLVSPNSLHAFPVSFGPGNLLSNVYNTTTQAAINQTHSVVIKLLATLATGNLGSATGAYCPRPTNPGIAPAPGGGLMGLASGLVAWGTHTYPANTGAATLTETPFVPAALSVGEISKLAGDCRSLGTFFSGAGCPGCITGGYAVPGALTPKLP